MLLLKLQAALLMMMANPATGDENAGIMKFIIGALIVSAILIVVFIVMSVKGKKGKKKKRK